MNKLLALCLVGVFAAGMLSAQTKVVTTNMGRETTNYVFSAGSGVQDRTQTIDYPVVFTQPVTATGTFGISTAVTEGYLAFQNSTNLVFMLTKTNSVPLVTAIPVVIKAGLYVK